MLNFYYLYAMMWGVIFILFSFRWSKFTSHICPEIVVFLLFTIVSSLFLGKMTKKHFKFVCIDKYPKRTNIVTVGIILLCMFEYAYCGQIPLLSIVRGMAAYKSYSGISGLHPLIITFAMYYMQYVFYLYLCFHNKKKLLAEYISIFLVAFLFQFNRGGMLISLMMSGLMYLASREANIKQKLKSISWKTILLIILSVLLVMYLFGCLGNMRHGGSWNDCSYIEYWGRFDSYPEWLPKQFMWAYLYITTPLNNLNYNIVNNTADPSFIGFFGSFLPDFVSKRICANSIIEPVLIDINFNATVGYGIAYMNGGMIGMYFMFAYIFCGLAFMLKYIKPRKNYRMPYICAMNAIVLLLFFTHTISFSAISFQIVYPVLSVFVINKKRHT